MTTTAFADPGSEQIVALILAGALTAAFEGGAEPGPGDADLEARTAQMQKDGIVYTVTVTVDEPQPAP